jgi:hypothetical protein
MTTIHLQGGEETSEVRVIPLSFRCFLAFQPIFPHLRHFSSFIFSLCVLCVLGGESLHFIAVV